MNFLLTTWRRLLREKFYAAVCVLSLALGIAGSVLISLYLYSELTFNHYHVNHDRIYRLTTRVFSTHIASTGYEIGPLIVDDYPQFLDQVRLRESVEKRLEHENLANEWEDVFFADPSLLEIFTLVPLRGDPVTALSQPNSIAISQTVAEYYFGDSDPIGETLSTGRFSYEVTLVFEDLPENVSQGYDALMPFESFFSHRPDAREQSGFRYLTNFTTYFLVADGFDPASIGEISTSLFRSVIAAATGLTITEGAEPQVRHELQKLGDLHFTPALLGDDSSGNIVNLFIFSVVVFALLLSSCINYVNLATARAATRTREVAIKKLLGAESPQLIGQFIGESMVFVGLGFLLGLLLATLLMKIGAITSLTGKSELSEILLMPVSIVLMIAAWLLIGLLSGLYPALKLSQPSMLSIMNTQAVGTGKALPLREILVWLQMAVAMAVVACVLIMLRQSAYLLEAPLGFEKQNRLVVQLQGADVLRGRSAVMEELRQHPDIINVAETSGAIGRTLLVSVQQVERDDGEEERLNYNFYQGGEDYLSTLDIEVIAGDSARLFLSDASSRYALVNETLARTMQWSEPIGMRIGNSEVAGVVRDFHYRPLHDPIGPLAILPIRADYLDDLSPSREETISMDLIIEYSGDNEASVRGHILDTIDRFSDQSVIDVVSLEEIWNQSYDDDATVINLVGVFAGLSIVISLLGLGGTVSYNNERRSKEIAIRKVLGASTTAILNLMGAGMTKVLLLATLPAFASAWYLSSIWLQRFAYQVDSTMAPFLISLLAVGGCSALVMLGQTWRTARANPVDKIKYE